MVVHNYTNTASTATLDAPLNSSANTFTVSSFTGYPQVPFWILMDRDTSSSELMEVTNVAGSTLTVTRGVGGTASTSHSASATIEHVIPALVPQSVEQHIEATANVHGVTGSLVGAENPGTLSNKTFQGAFVHSYSSGTPASPEGGFVVNADNSISRDGFIADGDGANADRRGFLLTQDGAERVEVFYDGTVRVTPSGSAVRPGIESTTNVRTQDLDVIDDAVVGGDIQVAGTTTTGNLSTGNLTTSGTVSVGGTTTLNALTAQGAVTASASGTGLTVSNAANIGSLNVTSGNAVLQGSNARLQLPSAPTAGSPGTAAGQVRYRNGLLETWNGSKWLGNAIGPLTDKTPSFTGVNNTQNRIICTFTALDIGYPYYIWASGQAEFNDVAGDTRWDLYCVLDSASNSEYITMGLGNGFAQTALGTSGSLTGAHTVLFVARRIFGAGTVNITGSSAIFTCIQIAATS